MYFIAGIIVGFLLAFIVGFITTRVSDTSDTSGWQIGDMVIINTHFKELKIHNVKFATLRGWDKTKGYVSIGDDVYQIELRQISLNKSAVWRANFNSCKEVMGVEPQFTAVINNEKNSETVGKSDNGHSQINGIEISVMNETECEVYLKLAIKKQMYEQAELIKKRMEKFR